jgi:hypothetical protein
VSDPLDERLDARAQLLLTLLADRSIRRARNLRSPEFRKNLDRLYTAIRDTQRLRHAGLLEREQEDMLRRLLLFADEPTTLNSDALGLLLEGVDQLLVEAGDEQLIEALLEIEYERDRYEGGGPIPTWSTIHGEERPTDIEDAKRRLSTLLRARHALYTLRRAREGTRATRLVWLGPILLLLVVAFIVLASWVGDDTSWKEGALAAVAGAAGATLAAGRKVREALPRMGDLRTFWYAFVLQLAVGAVAGVVLWAVLESGFVEFGVSGEGWAVVATLAFAGGFSEPFLLKTVERITGASEEEQRA